MFSFFSSFLWSPAKRFLYRTTISTSCWLATQFLPTKLKKTKSFANKEQIKEVLASHAADSKIYNKLFAEAIHQCYDKIQLSVARFLFKNGKVVDKTVVEEWHEYVPIPFDRFKTQENEELTKEEEIILSLLNTAQNKVEKSKAKKKNKKRSGVVVFGYDLTNMPKEMKTFLLVTLIGAIVIAIAYFLKEKRENDPCKNKKRSKLY